MLLIIVVCLLKSRCIPSFVLIVCCVNELLGHLGPYRDVWPEAACMFIVALQEQHCLLNFFFQVWNYIVYYNVYCYYCGVFLEKYVYTEFRLDWLLYE